MKDYRLYILMRNDIPSMGPGRAAAQASHAANVFIHEWGNSKTGIDRADVREWTRQTKQGFGTAIVLSASKDQISKIIRCRIPSGWVIDPDYAISFPIELVDFINPRKKGKIVVPDIPQPTTAILHRSEKTCGYVFGEKEDLQPILGNLPLLYA